MKTSKPRDYCCCAIPMVNAGIYATLITQTAAGILVGTLSIATPSIVGASTFSFAKWILATISYVAAGVQILGFIGVSRENPGAYNRYVTLHSLLTSAAFSVAAAWIIMSATRHSTAKANCIADFFTDTNGASTSEGDTLCNIFPWVDVGIMGGLWVILASLHLYFFFVISSYGKAQRRDHDQYDQVYDPAQPLTGNVVTESIPLQNDPWDSRPSEEYLSGRNSRYKHVRQQSSVSTSDVYNQPYQEPEDAFSASTFRYNAYPSQDTHNPTYPSYAHTQNALPTPTNDYYNIPTDSNRIERPLPTQPHPGE